MYCRDAVFSEKLKGGTLSLLKDLSLLKREYRKSEKYGPMGLSTLVVSEILSGLQALQITEVLQGA